MFFFFQAEDGIRDLTVTGVQTCALPISRLTAVQQVVEYIGVGLHSHVALVLLLIGRGTDVANAFRRGAQEDDLVFEGRGDRKSTRLNSSHSQISYAVFCLKKKTFQARC